MDPATVAGIIALLKPLLPDVIEAVRGGGKGLVELEDLARRQEIEDRAIHAAKLRLQQDPEEFLALLKAVAHA